MGGDVVEKERAFALLGAALAEREKTAQPAISRAVRRVGEQARRILQDRGATPTMNLMPTSLAARWARTTPASVLASVTAIAS